MSSEKGSENLPRRKLQGSEGRIVRFGVGGPKRERETADAKGNDGRESVPCRAWGTARDAAR
jgi:hypothetical protein